MSVVSQVSVRAISWCSFSRDSGHFAVVHFGDPQVVATNNLSSYSGVNAGLQGKRESGVAGMTLRR